MTIKETDKEADIACLKTALKKVESHEADLRAALAEANKSRGELSLMLNELVHNVRLGTHVRTSKYQLGKPPKEEVFRVVEIPTYFSNRKPSVWGVSRNLNGQWSKARRFIGSEYTVIGQEPFKEEKTA